MKIGEAENFTLWLLDSDYIHDKNQNFWFNKTTFKKVQFTDIYDEFKNNTKTYEFVRNILKSYNQWKPIETDIDFSKHTPVSTSNSLHIFEERYIIDNEEYKLSYPISDIQEKILTEIKIKQ